MPRTVASPPSTTKRSARRAPTPDRPAQTAENRSAEPARAASGNGLPGWANQIRLPLSWGLQTLMLALHAGEEWQRAQLDCWHLALKHHEQAHRRLLSSEDAAEMASLHADLLRFDTANLTHLSQRCMDTGVHLNTSLARLMAQALDGSRHDLMRSAFESFQTGMRTGIRPLDEIFNAPLLRELALRPLGPMMTAGGEARTAANGGASAEAAAVKRGGSTGAGMQAEA